MLEWPHDTRIALHEVETIIQGKCKQFPFIYANQESYNMIWKPS